MDIWIYENMPRAICVCMRGQCEQQHIVVYICVHLFWCVSGVSAYQPSSHAREGMRDRCQGKDIRKESYAISSEAIGFAFTFTCLLWEL